MRLNLNDLNLHAGQRHVCSYGVDIAPVMLGGGRFDVVIPDGVTVAVERIAGGFLVDLELTATVCGPCARCLREVCEKVGVTQEEFVPTTAGGWVESESEASPFIEDLMVDVSGLTREAVVLSMPDRILCTDKCKGLCPQCGADLNEGQCSCAPLEL